MARFEHSGSPEEVLTIANCTLPAPGPGEVLVKMLAAPINPSDLLYVSGQYGLKPEPPAGVGFEGVGVVMSHGGGLLGRWLQGQRVAVIHRTGGTWATACLTNARTVIPVPKSLSNEQAAQFFVNPATAVALTQHVLKLPRGDWLVQTAGGSVVAQLVSALGKVRGFRTISVVRRLETAELLHRQGVDRTIVWTEAEGAECLADQVHRITGPEGATHGLDPVGGATGTALLGTLKSRGQLIVYGTLSTEPVVVTPRQLIVQGQSVEGFWLGPFMDQLSFIQKLGLIRQLSQLTTNGTFSLESTTNFPFEDLAAALSHARSPQRSTKTILKMVD
jgi:NADPH:quinone reductase-like Zn-dependent oxidoreductase